MMGIMLLCVQYKISRIPQKKQYEYEYEYEHDHMNKIHACYVNEIRQIAEIETLFSWNPLHFG